jgi:hypothetical protein
MDARTRAVSALVGSAVPAPVPDSEGPLDDPARGYRPREQSFRHLAPVAEEVPAVDHLDDVWGAERRAAPSLITARTGALLAAGPIDGPICAHHRAHGRTLGRRRPGVKAAGGRQQAVGARRRTGHPHRLPAGRRRWYKCRAVRTPSEARGMEEVRP